MTPKTKRYSCDKRHGWVFEASTTGHNDDTSECWETCSHFCICPSAGGGGARIMYARCQACLNDCMRDTRASSALSTISIPPPMICLLLKSSAVGIARPKLRNVMLWIGCLRLAKQKPTPIQPMHYPCMRDFYSSSSSAPIPPFTPPCNIPIPTSDLFPLPKTSRPHPNS